jgi:hypothetical protein
VIAANRPGRANRSDWPENSVAIWQQSRISGKLSPISIQLALIFLIDASHS